MPVIDPDLQAEPGQMAFGCWTKDPFSTSEDQNMCDMEEEE
jgi:hypothetical protein